MHVELCLNASQSFYNLALISVDMYFRANVKKFNDANGRLYYFYFKTSVGQLIYLPRTPKNCFSFPRLNSLKDPQKTVSASQDLIPLRLSTCSRFPGLKFRAVVLASPNSSVGQLF